MKIPTTSAVLVHALLLVLSSLAEEESVTVNVFRNGGNNSGEVVVRMTVPVGDDPDVFYKFRQRSAEQLGYSSLIEEELRIGSERIFLYNRFGQRVHSTRNLKDRDLLYLVPLTERFIWPGVYIGYRVPLFNVPTPPGRTQHLEMETLSLAPRLFRIDNFLSDDEANRIITLARPIVKRSTVYGKDKHHVSERRTSSSGFLPRESDAIVLRIDERVGKLVHVPIEEELDETMHVVHYLPGQYYHAHTDWFSEEDLEGSSLYDGPSGQNRAITVFFFYLNDVEEGGETVFPMAGENGYANYTEVDFADCSHGLKVKPTKGTAILWYNVLPEKYLTGKGDPMALHAGCNVIRGEKWAANKWILNKKGNYGEWAAKRWQLKEPDLQYDTIDSRLPSPAFTRFRVHMESFG